MQLKEGLAMKYYLKAFTGALAVLIALETAFAQTEEGDREFSIAASFMSRKIEDADEAWTVFNIPIRLGFLITQNIEIEPEVLFSKYKEEDAGYILSANLAYNFDPTDHGENLVPFVFAGFGYSNTIIYLHDFPWVGSDNDNWTVLNLGGGLKIFVAEPVAVRMEYRFQNFSGDTDYTYHNVFIGLSVFL